ncbi:hypothetical protein [Aquimonas voraii]|nr:hypothetical protein [Aquimonas voraii]
MSTDTPQSAAPVHTPLDAEEAAAATALGALPAHAPSPALDARVLAMARAALAEAAPRPSPQIPARARRRPRALWWLGTAAGAVMAAGIGWQLGGFSDRAAPVRGNTAEPAGRAPGSAPADTTSEFEVLMIPRRGATGEQGDPETTARRQRSEPVAADRLRPAISQPSSRVTVDETAPPAAAPAEPPSEAVRAAPAPAPQAPAAEAAAPDFSLKHPPQESLDQISVTGTRIEGVDFPPVVQDFRLPPDAWIERIRARRDSGDVDSARRSLIEFVRANPQRVLPRDLRSLMNEAP